ncbi:MAG: trypsin-like peptidase domain-containing protein, partial [Monoglobales bacterium]
MKKFLTVLIGLALICTTALAAGDAKVIVNGKTIPANAVMINDRVYLPVRALSEELGANVSWDESTNSAIVDFRPDYQVISAIEKASKSVVAIVGNYKPEYMSQQALNYNTSYAHGAGVIIKNNGLILTNAHVVKNIENITVCFSNGDTLPATIKAMDEKADLALIKINKLGLTPVTFGSEDSISVGSTVIAIGTPLSLNMMNSASKGIVSGKNVNIGEYYSFTQSDVAINGGNSGGPLINLNGELVGINSSKYSGIGIEGMGFSIPVDTVLYIVNQLEEFGKVNRPDFGITLQESWEARIGLPNRNGLTVKSSTNPVIKTNDIITKINGTNIHSITDFNEQIRKTYTGGSLN